MRNESLTEITFNEEKFKVPEETQSFDKPEFKKFNMKFQNLDLLLIDAIAKRDGTSRTQIINMFIEQILKDSLKKLPLYSGLTISRYADEYLCDKKGKVNKDFYWQHWLIEQSPWLSSHDQAIKDFFTLGQKIDFSNKETIPPDLYNLLKIFKKHDDKNKELKAETPFESDDEH